MSIDPKLLKHMKAAQERNSVPQDDGVPPEEYLEGMTPCSGAPLVQRGRSSGLPGLTGTPKQVKWALTIRDHALALDWSPTINEKLRSIVDSTWWIANKEIVDTLKFKEPSPNQLAGPKSNPPAKGDEPSGSPQSPAAPSSVERAVNHVVAASKEFKQRPLPLERHRLNEAVVWASSVSKDPRLAEAAICSVLAKLYKPLNPAMHSALKEHTRQLLDAANAGLNKDCDAIRKMIES